MYRQMITIQTLLVRAYSDYSLSVLSVMQAGSRITHNALMHLVCFKFTWDEEQSLY